MNDSDHHDEIVWLEAQIDEFATRIESCRKFIVVGRIALAVFRLMTNSNLVGCSTGISPGLVQRRGAPSNVPMAGSGRAGRPSWVRSAPCPDHREMLARQMVSLLRGTLHDHLPSGEEERRRWGF
jgi:hypothetical protein